MKKGRERASGVVKFPIDVAGWEDAREGGMVVKLVVIDKNHNAKCGGAYVRDMLSESFIGDDKRPKPEKGTPRTVEELEEETHAEMEWTSYHFPMICGEDEGCNVDFTRRFMSRPYLAAIVLGSTNWIGWNSEKEEYWRCGKEDLSEQGKELYHLVEKTYPGCELHLLTFLET